MAITYSLRKDDSVDDEDTYRAVVQTTGTAGLEDIIERMNRPGSPLGRAEIMAVLEDYYTAIESLVLAGLTVDTPNATYIIHLAGAFKGLADSYDPNRHQVTVAVSPGSRLQTAVRERAKFTGPEQVIFQPELEEFIDLHTEARNGILTPGGMGQVLGHQLKFNPLDTYQGIYFINANGIETRVDVVGRNTPTELRFMVPIGLSAGNYTLKVKVAAPGSGGLRTGTLAIPLVVIRETRSLK